MSVSALLRRPRRRFFAIVIAAAGLFAASTCAQRQPPDTIVVKVLVLSFEPVAAGLALRTTLGWNDPGQLAAGYAHDLRAASGDVIRFDIAEWRNIPSFPRKLDGFTYSMDEYLKNHKSNTGWHQPDVVDYVRIVNEHGVGARVSSGEIDEVWLFGGPYFGYSESAMAGPRAFYINGEVLGGVRSTRPFAIMGFNYERGVAEMLENLCHRVEATMSRVYGGWRVEALDHNWARFAANSLQSGVAGVGSCHYPPNAEREYDFENPRVVMSSADAWLRYPGPVEKKASISSASWGGPDFPRNYFRWWFAHLPRAAGINPDGRLNNWWKYVLEFDRYDAAGRPRG